MLIIINPMYKGKSYYYKDFYSAFEDLENFGANIDNWTIKEFEVELKNFDALILGDNTIFLAYDGEG